MLQKHLLTLFLWCFFTFEIKCEVVSTTPSIIIIGAGASGIAAATKLLKNNITDFKILEAEDRIGGRIFSVKFGDAYIDLGAEFCHGESDNIVYDLTKDLNILKNSKEDNVYFFQPKGAELCGRLCAKLFDFVEDFLAENISCDAFKSAGDCLDAQYSQFLLNHTGDEELADVKRAKQWLYNSISAYDAPLDLHDMRAKSQFKDSDGDSHLSWNGLGYKTILDILMQKYPPTATPLPIDDKILLNKEVTKISKWNENGKVEVACKDGSTYSADIVIFSPSLGVLKADHQKLFEPSLPQEKVEAIESIGFGVIMKIFMEFSEATTLDFDIATVWMEDQFSTDKKNLSWLTALTALMVAPNNPRVIVGWYAGKELPRIESLSDEEIYEGQKYIVDNFLYFYYKDYNVSEPVRVARGKWYTNPHFRGTYSYESVKGADKDKDWFKEMAKPLLNKDNKPTVLFIGEATNPDHYSTVHGAIESGYREADNIIKKFA